LNFQVEKQRAELQRELDDLSQRLDEAGGATQAQVSEVSSNTPITILNLH
jgi:DNA-binding ferritin-like protein